MLIFYSPTNNSFLPGDLKVTYEESNSWPVDAKMVPYEVFEEFALCLPPSFNLKRGCDDNGNPCWVNIEQNLDVSIREEHLWLSAELDRVRDEIEKVQDSDPKSVGSVSDWRNYRKSLRAWVEHVEFPKLEFRPKAPDTLTSKE